MAEYLTFSARADGTSPSPSIQSWRRDLIFILRHDVDLDLDATVPMAELEAARKQSGGGPRTRATIAVSDVKGRHLVRRTIATLALALKFTPMTPPNA